MKKRFWTRLIAAVLTTAMAFSILAVPASAATGEEIKLTALGANMEELFEGSESESVTGVMWMTEEGLSEEVWSGYEGYAQKGSPYVKITNQTTGKTMCFYLYTEEIPSDAVIGFSADCHSPIFWYTEEELDAADKIWDSAKEIRVDKEKGLVIVLENGEEKSPKSIGTTKEHGWDESMIPSKPDTPSTPSAPSSGASSDGSAVIIVAVAGAAAAATGVYFYTHPEKWQEIKEYFADLSANVQAKVQEFTDGVKGALGIPTEEEETAETAEAAENAPAPQDAAA